MDVLGGAVAQALGLLLHGDAETWRVTLLSLQVVLQVMHGFARPRGHA